MQPIPVVVSDTSYIYDDRITSSITTVDKLNVVNPTTVDMDDLNLYTTHCCSVAAAGDESEQLFC